MKTILHVEDEESVIKLVKLMTPKGYNFRSATNLDKALSIIKLTKKIDLILLDLRIRKEKKIDGEFDGEELLKQLIELNKKIPVVIISALSEKSKGIKKKYPQLVKAIVNKPFLKKDFINALNKAIKKKRTKSKNVKK